MRLIARKKLPWRTVEKPKSPEKKSLWAVTREYVTFAIAVAAFVTSLFTLYISHYGGPQDFRVTTYLPRVTQAASDMNLDNPYALFNPIKEAEFVPLDKAKSFKLDIWANIVFINAGSSPILVSSVSIVAPFPGGTGLETRVLVNESIVTEEDKSIDCRKTRFLEVIRWTGKPFVVAPGAITPKDVSFEPYRSKARVSTTFCFHFVVVDRSGEEQTFTTSDFSVDTEGEGEAFESGRLQFLNDRARTDERQTTVLLNSMF